jgi:hypothetical protein
VRAIILQRAIELGKALAMSAIATAIAYGFGLGAGAAMFGWPS